MGLDPKFWLGLSIGWLVGASLSQMGPAPLISVLSGAVAVVCFAVLVAGKAGEVHRG